VQANRRLPASVLDLFNQAGRQSAVIAPFGAAGLLAQLLLRTRDALDHADRTHPI
jgi:hypothetical protein